MIAVDSSVAVKWVLPEPFSAQALALADAGDELVAPWLLPFEVANVVRRRMVREELSLADADLVLVRFAAFPLELRMPLGLSRRALVLADRFGLAAAYDAHYLALAEGLGCELWTDDRRLLAAVGRELPSVRWIGEFGLDEDSPGAGLP